MDSSTIGASCDTVNSVRVLLLALIAILGTIYSRLFLLVFSGGFTPSQVGACCTCCRNKRWTDVQVSSIFLITRSRSVFHPTSADKINFNFTHSALPVVRTGGIGTYLDYTYVDVSPWVSLVTRSSNSRMYFSDRFACLLNRDHGRSITKPSRPGELAW